MFLRFLFAACLLGGCAYDGSVELLLSPDAGRTGAGGQAGPHGVARERSMMVVRGEDSLRYAVFWPSNADGDLVDGPWPLVAGLGPGNATPDQLEWLPVRLASRGAVVVMPRGAQDLVAPEEANLDLVVDLVRTRADDDGDRLGGAVEAGLATALGLGGGATVALGRWLRSPERFGRVIALAGTPERGLDLSAGAGRSSLLLVGAQDAVTDAAAVQQAWEQMPEPSRLARIDGMTFHRWLDEIPEAEMALEPQPDSSPEEARDRSVQVMSLFMEGGLDEPDLPDLEGVVLE